MIHVASSDTATPHLTVCSLDNHISDIAKGQLNVHMVCVLWGWAS